MNENCVMGISQVLPSSYLDTEMSPWYLPHPLSPGPALGWGGILVLHLDNCPYPHTHTHKTSATMPSL